ncbi:hypothetical protein QBC46DRAFT_123753 [Diplogelasinospora grovesii]|uniref:Uncharacterized protein n=1 Tax=Diplogelasinospora grovesii TaxID=303347 RepID=A0AAN6S4A8_9PEZI|nr:hypothetical protein QBC46DRAFT_123753 [Diplogelasinospora grovesii]
MAAYYEPSQWQSAGQAGWEHQTPPPARSGASSAVPREEPSAFTHQIEEVDRAVDNLMKSGKMYAVPGGRRHDGRVGAGHGSRPHPMADFTDMRGHQPHGHLQNFYTAQRHQTSRGSNEAEQMIQAKRRMAAQRERELRNYHQEQQYNRTVLAELSSYGSKPDRTLSPGSMSEDERRELIARQRSALYGENSFGENGGFVDETGAPRPGLPPAGQAGPASLRGHSPLAFEYGRTPSTHADAGSQPSQPSVEGGQGSQSAAPNERSRANSSSPQSNPSGSKGAFDAPAAQQVTRTSASSPGGSPPRQGPPASKPAQGAVAPIGTRPSVSAAPSHPALSKRSTTPLPSPLSQGYTASGNDENSTVSSGAPSSSTPAAAEGSNVGFSGWGGRPNGWGSKSGLGVQASVWG